MVLEMLPSSSCERRRPMVRWIVAADARAAGERVERDPLLLEQPHPDLGSPAVHQIQVAGRHARIRQHLAQQRGRERRLRGRLQHHGIAGRQRRPHLVRDRVQRRIERRDRADHAYRHPQREGQAILLARRSIDGHDLAGNALGLLATGKQRLDRPGDFVAGIADGEAAFRDDGRDELARRASTRVAARCRIS